MSLPHDLAFARALADQGDAIAAALAGQHESLAGAFGMKPAAAPAVDPGAAVSVVECQSCGSTHTLKLPPVQGQAWVRWCEWCGALYGDRRDGPEKKRGRYTHAPWGDEAARAVESRVGTQKYNRDLLSSAFAWVDPAFGPDPAPDPPEPDRGPGGGLFQEIPSPDRNSG